MALKGKLYCNKYIPFNPIGGDLGLWKIIFWTASCQNKRPKSNYKIYSIKKNYFEELNVEVMLLILQIVIIFENFQLISNYLLFTTFPLFVSICKRSNFAKVCKCCSTSNTPNPDFYEPSLGSKFMSLTKPRLLIYSISDSSICSQFDYCQLIIV